MALEDGLKERLEAAIQEDIASRAEPDAAPEAAETSSAAPEVEAAAAPVDEPPAEKPAESESWIDDDIRAKASAFGVDDLSDFETKADFDRFARAATKHLVDAAQGYRQQQAPPQTTSAAPAAAAPQTAAAKKLAEEAKEAGYDETVQKWTKEIDDLREWKAQQEQARAAEQQQRIQAERQRTMDEFHDALDVLDADRYGKSVDEKGKPIPLSKEADAHRAKVYEMAETIAVGAIARGRPVPPIKVLTQLADQAVFAAENREREKKAAEKNVTDKVRAQSRRRLGGDARVPAATKFRGPLEENPDALQEVRDILDRTPA